MRVVHASEHLPEHYGDHLDGHRAAQWVDDDGMVGGELAWRLTGRWHCRCEIRDFGLFSDVHR